MSQDFAGPTGAPAPWRFEGLDYRASKFSARDFGEVQKWLMTRLPNPKAEARKLIEGLPPELARIIWDSAVAEHEAAWPPDLNDPRSRVELLSVDGMALWAFLALRKGIAGFDMADARALAERMSDEDFDRLMDAVLPEMPRPLDEPGTDPATPRPGTTTPTPGTTTSP